MQRVIPVTQNFWMITKSYNDGHKLIVEEGGQGSSKTLSTMQLLYIIAKKKKRRLITVCSYALPHLKGGAMKYFEMILGWDGVNVLDVKHKSENTFYINNSEIEFIGLESNPARVTGNRRDILYINELNNKISYEVFDLAASRTHEAVFVDYNPRSEFWLHEKVLPNFDHKLIRSNFTHNEHIPESELRNILSKKDKPGFENWWRVYGLGEVGKLEGTIFNYTFGKFDETLPYGYGLDFGSNDPDAFVKCAIDQKNKKYYVKQEFKINNLGTDQLTQMIKARNTNNKLIVADSTGKRSIQDLKKSGLNINPVEKYPGCVLESIKNLWNYEIIIDPESYDLSKELNNYIWLDKKSETPIDSENHLIDAMRYYHMTMTKPNVYKGVRIL